MIVTVTLNPSVDRTLSVDELRVGSINRSKLIAVDPGGKGVNVSRALASYGADTFALLVCGDLGDEWFHSSLNVLNISHAIVKAEGITRSNVAIVDASGNVTKINEPGFVLTSELVSEVKAALTKINLEGAWVVLAGKLNAGADINTYKELAEFARARGAKIALDGSGPEFAAAMKVKPNLIKPNQFELAELVGRALPKMSDIVSAAREVIDRGIEQVLCSLGMDGALLVTADRSVHCEAETIVHGTPVGAGDILLAIFLGGGAHENSLKDAVAWSAASVPLAGTGIPTHEQAAKISVKMNTNPDFHRELAEVH